MPGFGGGRRCWWPRLCGQAGPSSNFSPGVLLRQYLRQLGVFGPPFLTVSDLRLEKDGARTCRKAQDIGEAGSRPPTPSTDELQRLVVRHVGNWRFTASRPPALHPRPAPRRRGRAASAAPANSCAGRGGGGAGPRRGEEGGASASIIERRPAFSEASAHFSIFRRFSRLRLTPGQKVEKDGGRFSVDGGKEGADLFLRIGDVEGDVRGG